MKRSLQLAVLCLAVVTLASPAGADGYVLIRNAKSPSGAMAQSEIRAIYTGKEKLFGNDAVVVVVPTDDAPAFASFADQVFRTNTKTLLSKIKQEVFKGEMSKPLKAASDEEVIRLVSGTAGTIGVIAAATAKSLPATVTVIRVGG